VIIQLYYYSFVV